jgi:hypothetical protein
MATASLVFGYKIEIIFRNEASSTVLSDDRIPRKLADDEYRENVR